MPLPYILHRSRRKTLAIHIQRDGTIEVRAPLRLPQGEIDRILAEKQEWIYTHQSRQQQAEEARKSFLLQEGTPLLYLGQEYPLRLGEGERATFDGTQFLLPRTLDPEGSKVAMEAVYRSLAKTELPRRVAQYAKQMGVTPTAVKINGAKTRWGSCSGKNSLNFSWRLLLAPPEVVDYVVVHELAHIKEHNHSAAFWAEVARVFPDYRQRQQGLRPLQERLLREDW